MQTIGPVGEPRNQKVNGQEDLAGMSDASEEKTRLRSKPVQAPGTDVSTDKRLAELHGKYESMLRVWPAAGPRIPDHFNDPVAAWNVALGEPSVACVALVLSQGNDLLEFRPGISVAVAAACLEVAKQTITFDQPPSEAGGKGAAPLSSDRAQTALRRPA